MTKSAILLGLPCMGLATVCLATQDKAAYDKAYQEAEAARQQAAAVGYEWRDTAEILKKAALAAEKGDYDQAVELAEQAKMQGERAFSQARKEEQAWERRVPR